MHIKLLFIAGAYAIFETTYFGWNWSPHSDAEVIADGIAFLLLAIAYTR